MKNTTTVNPTVATALAAFTTDTVANVYSGKNGKCCCGCAGTHRYATRFADKATVSRGYAVTAEEINDTQVRRVLNTLLAAESPEELEFADDRTHVARVVNGRLYIAYLASN